MTNSFSIGITGGIGSGKSIVCRIFKILGIPVYDADSRARFILNNDPDLKIEIIRLFGTGAYTNQGLNNQWIASNIFHDIDKLDQMNDLVHPKVGKDFESWRNKFKDSPYLIKEAALLYESGSYKTLDKVIVVTAPLELRIQRILKRDPHRTLEQVGDILKRQWPEEDKIEKADFLIINDGDHLIIPQVLELHDVFLNMGTVSPGQEG